LDSGTDILSAEFVASRNHVESPIGDWRSQAFGRLKLPLLFVGPEIGEGVGGGFFKTRETAAEDEFYLVGWAVALLGDEDVGHVAFFGVALRLKKLGR